MKKNGYNNVNSIGYVPSPSDLGYSDSEMMEKSGDPIFDREYGLREKEFVSRNISRIKDEQKRKRQIKIQNYSPSWYDELPENEVINLIQRSRSIADEVINHMNKGQSLESMISYNEGLRARVKLYPIEVRLAPEEKKSKFPKYDEHTGQLFGSKYSFYRLWCHIFSTRSVRRSSDTRC